MRLAFSVLLIWSLSGLAAGTGEVIHSAADLVTALQSKENAERPFALRVQATSDCPTGDAGNFAVCDKTGAASLADKVEGSRPVVRDGDVIRVTGRIEPAGPTCPDPKKPHANCYGFSVVSPGVLPPPEKITARQILSRCYRAQRVCIDGVIRDETVTALDEFQGYFAFAHSALALD